MPQQLIKVRPTKIEFIRLRRRLVLAERIQKIVKDKLSILTLEFLGVVKETVEAKKNLLGNFSSVYRALSMAAGYHGFIALEKELAAGEKDLKIAGGVRGVAGVRIPTFELKADEKAIKGYSLIDTSSWFDRAADLSGKCLEATVELAELQKSLDLLGKEINRTKRIVNALEYIIIPGLRSTIKYLYMKFEERDREEKSRLKRVKVLLGQR
jgi:V/A-type H+-transporting ATPase subunit D